MIRILLLLILAACSTPSDAPAPAPSAAAKEVFETRCAACHGREGKGDGPASASLAPRPRDFHDTGWQRQITDEHIERIIHLGGSSVGKSASMPANPDLSPPVIAALRELIRNYGQ
jgi:mono/diheme cytochrome c family protein